MSRHWSDIATMSVNEGFSDERLDFSLLAKVVNFKKTYFPTGWANYDTASPGTMCIVPRTVLANELRDDYKQMGEMFLEKPLSFDEIAERLQALEYRINARNQSRGPEEQSKASEAI
jgi:hypothetical protein